MVLRILRRVHDAFTDDEVQALNTEDRYGVTPLMWACDGGHEEAVRKIVELGADVLRLSVATGRTAIHAACHMNRLDIVMFLCYKIDDMGCSVEEAINVSDKGGLTPLSMAYSHGDEGERLFLYLLEQGATWNEYNPLSHEPIAPPMAVAC